jgi:hypothetical protein
VKKENEVSKRPAKLLAKTSFFFHGISQKNSYIYTLSLFHPYTHVTHVRARVRTSVHTCESAPPPVNGESSEQGESIMLRCSSIIASKHRYQPRNHRIKPNAKFGPTDAMHLRDCGLRPTIQYLACVGLLWASRDECQTGTHDDLWHGSYPRFSSVLGAWERSPN